MKWRLSLFFLKSCLLKRGGEFLFSFQVAAVSKPKEKDDRKIKTKFLGAQ